MKGVIAFRGVGIPQIREVVGKWRPAAGLDSAPLQEQFDTAVALIREPVAEDKLAGIIYLQEYLNERIAWRAALPEYASLFDDGFIHDWSICDWFCVRVLGPTIRHRGLPFRSTARRPLQPLRQERRRECCHSLLSRE